jgi:hypothetical protein
MTPIWEQSTSHGEARSLTSRGSHQPEASVLVLRVFDLAPKGRDKSAQGNALGLQFQPTVSPEGAAQLEAPGHPTVHREKPDSSA